MIKYLGCIAAVGLSACYASPTSCCVSPASEVVLTVGTHATAGMVWQSQNALIGVGVAKVTVRTATLQSLDMQ